MKKLYILFLIVFITGCSSFGNKEGIEKAKTEAIEERNLSSGNDRKSPAVERTVP